MVVYHAILSTSGPKNMRQMVRVLLCAPYKINSGGISIWTDNIAEYYSKYNNDFELSLDIFSTARTRPIYANTSLCYRIIRGYLDYIPIILSYKKIINSSQFRVIHITSSASIGLLRDIIMLRLAARSNSKSIIHFRFGRIPEVYRKKRWEYKLIDKVIKLADKVIVIDSSSFNILHNSNYNNICFLPNPIGMKTQEIIRKSQICKKKGKIIFVGHVVPSKGVFELIQACKAISGINLRIIGEVSNDVKSTLCQLAGKDNNWLEIIGQQNHDKVINEMLSADIFVLPSYTEGFPNVILESMACGCSIVATSVGAIPEMLNIDSESPCGICVDKQNVVQLKQAIEKMLTDESFAQECRNNAIKRVLSEYSMDVVWDKLIRIWYDLSRN